MGIEKFATFIGNNYRECRQYKLPPNIASLFIDCNGIFHKAKAKVYLLETNRDFKLIHTNEERKALKANKRLRGTRESSYPRSDSKSLRKC